ncbi:DMT family transporter [Azospirillum halopraeferens]|uniref:DMT family transporter n=1 Tax=Azospirillum halopraeferens TaxID=34010 RepID=UPI00041666E1|nr:DMT family transporter [Azospirillum halopraeferens]
MTVPTIHRAMTPREWALLLTLSILWGGSFFFVGVAVRELPPLTIVAARVGLAAVALHAAVRFVGAGMPTGRAAWLAFLAMGVLNNVVPFTLITWAQGHISSGLASILNATTPLLTALVAHRAVRDEPMSAGRLAGVLVGLAGVAAMVGGAIPGGTGTQTAAQLACLAAALSYAVAGVFGRRFRAMGITPLQTATGQITASALLLLPVMLLVDQPRALPLPSAGAVAAVVGLALLSTALAYILFFRILATAGATNIALVTFLIPVTATLPGIAVLGEVAEPRYLLGLATIGLGLAAIDGRPFRALRRLRRPAA